MKDAKIKVVFVAFVASALLWTGNSIASETGSLDEHLAPFRPFLAKTWRGEFKDSKPDHPAVDVSRWERALNGKAIRILHSVNNGQYGGESLVFWDAGQKEIRYYYFTTAGFYTTGTASFTDGKFVAVEKVTGETNGISEVRSTCELRADGTMLKKATFVKDGQATGGPEILYREDSMAEVKFN
jgi:hypothetical protein